MEMRKVLRYMTDANYRFLFNAYHFPDRYKHLSDEDYLRRIFFASFNRKLDLVNPVTYNEKLQWLKLHDRQQQYINLVDKYKVKNYIISQIGSQYVIPTYGVWDKFAEIDFDVLPDQFVLKCTHDSGGGDFGK